MTKNMTTIEVLEWMGKIADGNTCDGLCDVPEMCYIKCKECWARHFLNSISEIVRGEKHLYENDGMLFSPPVEES